MTANIGVLALQGDFREHARMLGQLGAHVRLVRRPTELAGLDGIVLPGGESTTIGKLLVTCQLLEPLRAALRDGLPAYGSCAGMILLADRVLDGVAGQLTLGGLDATVRRNSFGRQIDSAEAWLAAPALRADPAAGQEPLHAVFIRAPWVEEYGPTVQVLAAVETPRGRRAVAVRQGHLLATSFHPEVSDDTRVHEAFLRLVAEVHGT
ncbi:pyridoxal 5'-phosphate synthase glutaminase subunit PdxT [Buchananella hordeovulneris]|uniref:pyridoxal 5'-phosphate synthase glutaminase subunit PdxT n=1 Tax=Buchananella hordeovulneris TaxID=52770 RepID=UPI0026DD508B|nr:pyridoxal 5'-phosphate synthase glutaminase subunit PdxT [Buchananella hordeovulneris]MDO5080985.1 pyridoxal 5'-phosphate synthase glutaminase subunit PdxT [Buchananella hordeovulneris]